MLLDQLAALRAELDSLRTSVTGKAAADAAVLEETRQNAAAAAALSGPMLQLGYLDELRRNAAIAADRSMSLAQSRAVPIGSEILVRGPHGWLMVPAEDPRLVVALVEGGGVLEAGTLAVIDALLSPGDTAVDVGAHIGSLTLAMARAVASSGRVIAVEPTPRSADLLRRTAVLNSLESVVELKECAAGAVESNATLAMDAVLGHNSLLVLPGATSMMEVRVHPLDTLLPLGVRPALVKIDVEGAELDVLRGMGRTIAETPDLALIVEFAPVHLARAGTPPAEWLAAFAAHGFVPWEISEGDGTLRPVRKAGLDGVFSVNLLMLRRPPSYWARLRLGT